jgi:hypothetical protein
MEVLTLIAIFAGPISAILVSRHLDARKEQRDRQMDIFRTLMRTRRTPVWADHVGALNLVEIEFKDDSKVIAAWKALFEHFAARHVRAPNEQIAEAMTPEEAGQRNQRFDERLGTERQKLLAKLLHAIAKRMRFNAEQLDIFEGGYTPQGWEDVETEQRLIRQFALEFLAGRRSVPVAVMDYSNPAGGR